MGLLVHCPEFGGVGAALFERDLFEGPMYKVGRQLVVGEPPALGKPEQEIHVVLGQDEGDLP